MVDEHTGNNGHRERRSPSFPYLELSAALGLVQKLLNVAKQSEVRLVDIAGVWNTTPTSGALARYVAALQAYGLIETSGSGNSRKIRISESGRRIIEDNRPGVRKNLCSDAVLRPRLLAELFEHWGYDRPDDTIAKSHLQFDRKFSSDAARRFLVVYDSNLDFIVADNPKASQSHSGNPGAIQDEPDNSIVISPDSAASGRNETQRPSPTATNVQRYTFALDEGEVALLIPSEISMESFEDFSAWLDLITRKIRRGISRQSDQATEPDHAY